MTKVFTHDEEDSEAENPEFNFLHKKTENTTDAESFLWDWPTQPDVDIVSSKQILFGPVDSVLTDAHRGKSYFQFSDEKSVMQKFNLLNKSGLNLTKKR